MKVQSEECRVKSERSIIVNAITFARVPLIFAWLGFAVAHEYLGGWSLAVVACAMMLLSGLTDIWDGMLARKWNCVSTLGKMADPLMDKVFYLVAFPELTWQIVHQGGDGFEFELHGLVMLGFTILYLLRDTWVTFMRSVGTMYGADVSAMWLGKVRTALSFPGAGWIYLYLAFSPMIPTTEGGVVLKGYWLMSCFWVEGALALLTVWSLITYTAAYMPYLKRALGK